MRKALGLVGATLLLAGPAVAADLAVKAPRAAPALMPVYNWTGFYIGINGGGAWQSGDTQSVDWTSAGFDPGPSFGNSSNGKGIFGVQLGYNYQFPSNWVLGVEGDFDWTSLGQTNAGTLNFHGVPFGIANTQVSDKTDWLASFRGRLGFAMGQFLPYATAGVAWSKRDFNGFVQANSTNPVFTEPFSANSTSTGWVAGGGIEWMVMPNLLLRAEYLHYGLDNGKTVAIPLSSALPNFPAFVTYGKTDVDVVRAGLSFKF
jgi:outer membrane immunogenic protein